MTVFAVFATVLSALVQSPSNAAEGDTVVVTGRSMDSTRRALAECLRRGCPPAEDIELSAAHAETAFVAGEYREERSTLLSSLGRNRRHARTLPVEVSELERANGLVSAHLGEQRSYEFSIWGIRRALKAGLPEDDVRLLQSELEIADMLLSTGKAGQAGDTYENVARQAQKRGDVALEGRARVRRAWLSHPLGEEDQARRRPAPIAANKEPGAAPARLAALSVLARMERAGNETAVDALVAAVSQANTSRPVLLWTPQIGGVLKSGKTRGFVSGIDLLANDRYEGRWIDLGFAVDLDGRVRDVEVLRSRGATDWADGLLKSVGGRRYSATKDGGYRVERYSYTSFHRESTGTRIRQRTGEARIEFLDLTAPPATPAQ